MIEERTGDIFKQTDLNVIAHQANCFHTFGSGIAKIIRELYPEAYEADLKTKKGDPNKLGTYSRAIIKRGDRLFAIANVYGQFDFGGRNEDPPRRDTRYDALYDGLKLLHDDTIEVMTYPEAYDYVKIGIPYGLGSMRGGASWKIVREMIEDIFNTKDVDAVICKLPNTLDL